MKKCQSFSKVSEQSCKNQEKSEKIRKIWKKSEKITINQRKSGEIRIKSYEVIEGGESKVIQKTQVTFEKSYKIQMVTDTRSPCITIYVRTYSVYK